MVEAFREFHVDWRVKAFAIQLFDRLPFGKEAYYQVQRRITHTVPRQLHPTEQTARWFLQHARVLSDHAGPAGLGSLAIFEFGAGWDLYGNCVAWCLGADRQVVFDLTRWARPDLINLSLEHLRQNPPPGAVRVPETLVPTKGRFEDRLREIYGIEYNAPGDAGATGLPEGALTAGMTTSVLEHIPPEQIARILRETHRILPPGAIMSHVIDYSDHYAHSDARITPYHYLSFEEPTWRRFNPGIHYQNRLRHVDYRPLFESAGFRIVSDEFEQPGNADELLSRVKVSGSFAHRSRAELAPLVGHYVVERV